MTSQEIKNITLNYELTEEILKEYLCNDFRRTMIGVLNALYELVNSYDKNQALVDGVLLMLEGIATEEQDVENIKVFYCEVKRLNGNIHRYLKPEINWNLKPIVRRLQDISRSLRQTMMDKESSEKIATMEILIDSNRNLKIIAGLIRDNKDILKIKDAKSEDILYKLLRRYSNLDEALEEEINYLYQVISLFINSEDLNIEIIKEADYYIAALENRKLKHVRQMVRQLETKKQPITLAELENRFHIYTKYPSRIEKELNNFRISHNGAIDLRGQYSFTIDDPVARCLDDAIYWKRNKDGSYTLYVHITYVPAIIPYLSKINRESIKRVETYHLIDGAYCLYPDYISNYLASLLPHNVRHTETGIWLVEPDMTLVEDSFHLVKSTINSHHRLTYEGADEIIGSKSKEQLCQILTPLGRFALKQREKNNAKEAYRQRENASSNNPSHESRLVDKSVAANIVQECALLFGRSKAEYYKKRGLPYIFRACGEQQKLDLDGSLLKNLTEENKSRIASMAAYYTPIPEMHHGLGYEAYCHGGSPARRSPDGQNQYIDEDLIFNPNPSDKTVYMWEERTKRLAEYYNETSQRIDAFSNQYNYLTSKQLIRRK